MSGIEMVTTSIERPREGGDRERERDGVTMVDGRGLRSREV